MRNKTDEKNTETDFSLAEKIETQTKQIKDDGDREGELENLT